MAEPKEPEEPKKGISRRKLLAGGVVATPTLALLHQTVPHQGLHNALSGGEASAATGDEVGRMAHSGHMANTAHAGFVPGAVDHLRNGFDPSELVRDFDYGRTRRLASGRVLREWELFAQDKRIEVAPGVRFDAWT